MTKLRHIKTKKGFKLVDNHKSGNMTQNTTLFEIRDLNAYLRYLEEKKLWSVEEYKNSIRR